jgi:hypothetical protein
MEEQERPEETPDVEGHKHHDPSVGARVAATDDDDVEAHKHHAPKAGAPQVGATDDDDDVEAHGRVPGHVPSPKAG